MKFVQLNLVPHLQKIKQEKFGPDIFGWGEGLPREGAGAKKFGMSFETQKPNFLAGYPGNFGGVSRACPKSLRISIFGP